jgi:hypothetical protein
LKWLVKELVQTWEMQWTVARELALAWALVLVQAWALQLALAWALVLVQAWALQLALAWALELVRA